jgi:hypothetical protein
MTRSTAAKENRPGYHAYIQSDAWKTRRAKVYAAAKGTCLACGRPAGTVHHRSYDRLGQESDADLVALCWDCHQACHLHHVEHADLGLWKATNTVIAERRVLFGLPPVRLPSERSARRRSTRPATTRRGERQKQANAIPVNSQGRMEIRSVRCPKCGAHAGEQCLSSSELPRPANHQRRVVEYQRIAKGEPPSKVRSRGRRYSNRRSRKN